METNKNKKIDSNPPVPGQQYPAGVAGVALALANGIHSCNMIVRQFAPQVRATTREWEETPGPDVMLPGQSEVATDLAHGDRAKMVAALVALAETVTEGCE